MYKLQENKECACEKMWCIKYHIMKRKWVERMNTYQHIFFNEEDQVKICYFRTNTFSNKTEMKMKSTHWRIELKLKYDTKLFFFFLVWGLTKLNVTQKTYLILKTQTGRYIPPSFLLTLLRFFNIINASRASF